MPEGLEETTRELIRLDPEGPAGSNRRRPVPERSRDCGEEVDLRLVGLAPVRRPRSRAALTLAARLPGHGAAADRRSSSRSRALMTLLCRGRGSRDEAEVVLDRDPLKLCAGTEPRRLAGLRAARRGLGRPPPRRRRGRGWSASRSRSTRANWAFLQLGPGTGRPRRSPARWSASRACDRTAQTDAFGGRFRLHGPVGRKEQAVRLQRPRLRWSRSRRRGRDRHGPVIAFVLPLEI